LFYSFFEKTTSFFVLYSLIYTRDADIVLACVEIIVIPLDCLSFLIVIFALVLVTVMDSF